MILNYENDLVINACSCPQDYNYTYAPLDVCMYITTYVLYKLHIYVCMLIKSMLSVQGLCGQLLHHIFL